MDDSPGDVSVLVPGDQGPHQLHGPRTLRARARYNVHGRQHVSQVLVAQGGHDLGRRVVARQLPRVNDRASARLAKVQRGRWQKRAWH